ncbi:MAG: energy transducer TonB [Pseudomonadota bacterium]
MGDDPTTAVLAYNYGNLIVFDDPETAEPALLRAKEFADRGEGGIPVAALETMLAYAKFVLSDKRRGDRRDFLSALEAVEQLNAPPTIEQSRAWLTLASGYFISKRYKNAASAADRAMEFLEATMPESKDLRAEILIMRAIAKVVPHGRSAQDANEAHIDIMEAQKLFPPQPSMYDYSQIVMDVAAWDAAIHSLAGTRGWTLDPASDPDIPDLFESWADRPADCGGRWSDRLEPRFPDEAARKSQIGAVLIAMSVDDQGVTDAKVLSEVPPGAFGEAALAVVKQWRWEEPPSPARSCRTDVLTQFSFQMKR